MSMTKEECLHDCTCCAKGATEVRWGNGDVTEIPFVCDLPEGHADGIRHWDPTWGWWTDRTHESGF